MAQIPNVLRTVKSQPLTSFSFNDIASGSGVQIFYPGKTVDLNMLSTSQWYSDPIYTSGVATAGAATKVIDVDFDVLMNLSRTIKGTLTVNIPMRLASTGTSAQGYVIAKLRKWDGASESDLATNQSNQFESGVAGTTYNMLSIDLTPSETKFKKGETIRITLEGYAWGGAAGSSIYLGHDPNGRGDATWLSATLTSTSTANIPFRIFR